MTESARYPFARGPYVAIACFCEKVLREEDGVLSLIRLVDKVTAAAHGSGIPLDMPEFRYPLSLVLGLKSGTARGRCNVEITPQLPSGETMPSMHVSFHMEGGARGVNLVAPIDVPYRQEGVHWFIVQFEGTEITRIPLEIVYSRLATG